MSTENEYAYDRVAKALIADIYAGCFPAGKRLPGCRKIGAKYEVCMITARQAVEKLENAGILQRMGARGTFVRPEFIRNGAVSKQFSVVYPVAPDFLLTHSFESWNIYVEIMRGLAREAALRNVNLEYELLGEHATDDELGGLYSRLALGNGTVFIGTGFETLAKRLNSDGIANIAVMTGAEDYSKMSVGCRISSIYSTVASYIAFAEYSRVDIVDGSFKQRSSPHSKSKIEALCKALAERRIDVKIVSAESMQELPELMKPAVNRLIYAMNTSSLPVIFRYASEYGMVPGREFELLAFATGHTFSNFYPRVSFFRPRYENFGRAAVIQLLGEKYDDIPMTPEFVQGDTTRKISVSQTE